VIYCDHHIGKALQDGRLVIDPPPEEGQYESSAVDLRISDDLRRWKKSLGAKGTGHSINLDDIELSELLDFTEPLVPNEEGLVVLKPNVFVLALTREYVYLPAKGKLAARVEGRSKMARLGIAAHITAPTIHAGFRGRIALPRKQGSTSFNQQTTVLGTPKSR
jgi:dCTP deaminase